MTTPDGRAAGAAAGRAETPQPFAQLTAVLTAGVQLVAAFFAVNNRFFDSIRPPSDQSQELTAGTAWFLTLGILLVLRALPERIWRGRGRWVWFLLVIGGLLGFLATSRSYGSAVRDLTFLYPPDDSVQTRMVAGTVARSPMLDSMLRHDGPAVVVSNSGGTPDSVWTAQSLADASRVLSDRYVLFVVFAAATTFALLELVASATNPTPPN